MIRYGAHTVATYLEVTPNSQTTEMESLNIFDHLKTLTGLVQWWRKTWENNELVLEHMRLKY